jgi:hypothetical protein
MSQEKTKTKWIQIETWQDVKPVTLFFGGVSLTHATECSTYFLSRLRHVLSGIHTDASINPVQLMSGTAGIDAPGLLHRVRAQGIERRKVFLFVPSVSRYQLQ